MSDLTMFRLTLMCFASVGTAILLTHPPWEWGA